MPPCFGSAARATLETARTHKTPAASARTLRMVPSLELRPHGGPINETISWRAVEATRKGQCRYWYFGLARLRQNRIPVFANRTRARYGRAAFFSRLTVAPVSQTA